MTPRIRTLTSIIALAIALPAGAAVLAGCGGSSPQEPSTTAPAPRQVAVPARAA